MESMLFCCSKTFWIGIEATEKHSQLAVSNVFWVLRMVSLVNEMEQRLPPALLRSYVVNGSSHGMHRSDDLWTMEYQGVLAQPCITHPMSSGTVNFLVPKLSEMMMIMWSWWHGAQPGVKFIDWIGNLSSCWFPVTWDLCEFWCFAINFTLVVSFDLVHIGSQILSAHTIYNVYNI